jgi:hypothetical protein
VSDGGDPVTAITLAVSAVYAASRCTDYQGLARSEDKHRSLPHGKRVRSLRSASSRSHSASCLAGLRSGDHAQITHVVTGAVRQSHANQRDLVHHSFWVQAQATHPSYRSCAPPYDQKMSCRYLTPRLPALLYNSYHSRYKSHLLVRNDAPFIISLWIT